MEYDDKVFEFGTDLVSPLYALLQADPTKRPKAFSGGGSALHRGHIALYRVTQGKLWLVNIEVPVSDDNFASAMGRFIDDRPYAPFPLTRLFPDCAAAVHVAWFSGDLKLTHPPSKAELEADKSISTRHEILTFKDGILTFATKATIQPKSDSKNGK